MRVACPSCTGEMEIPKVSPTLVQCPHCGDQVRVARWVVAPKPTCKLCECPLERKIVSTRPIVSQLFGGLVMLAGFGIMLADLAGGAIVVLIGAQLCGHAEKVLRCQNCRAVYARA